MFLCECRALQCSCIPSSGKRCNLCLTMSALLGATRGTFGTAWNPLYKDIEAVSILYLLSWHV